MGGKVNRPPEPLMKGPQGPRRYPGQNEAAQRRRDAEQTTKDADMTKKMQEARRRFDESIESDTPGYRGGGMPDLTGDGKVTRADVLKGRGVFKHGGKVKKYSSGGSASSRADGIAKKGKTRGRIV